MAFQRGFKSRCEALSQQIRQQLKLGPCDVLDPKVLAEYIGVKLWPLQELARLAAEVRDRLEGEFASEWSAVTLVAGPTPVIVFNSAQSRRRLPSTLMHEIAHVLLDHTPGNMFFGVGGMALRTFDKAQEAEADWLSGCLLLPREALLEARRRGESDEAIRDRYGVSSNMLRFRLNATGVDRQIGARRPRVTA